MRVQLPEQSMEHLSYEVLNDRERFYQQLMNVDGIGVRVLPPNVALYPNTEGNAMIATRQDYEKFGVAQMLHSIVRAGDHAYGIAQAHGPNVEVQGQPYVVKLSDLDTFTGRPTFIGKLKAGERIEVEDPVPVMKKAKPAKAVPTMTDRFVVIGMDDSGKIKVSVPYQRHRPALWITGINSSVIAGGSYNPLEQESGSWSLPPRFLISALKEVDSKTRLKRGKVKSKPLSVHPRWLAEDGSLKYPSLYNERGFPALA